MKIRVTLEVTDDARRCIAANAIREAKAKGQLVAESKFTTGNGLARREFVAAWLQAAAHEAGARFEQTPKLDAVDREETRLAVEQLRAAGWRDSRIKSWLLKQAALMEGVKLTLWEEPLLRTQPATQVENPQPGA
jgi:hypothetical protein